MIKDTIQVERLALDDYKINLKPLIESMQKGDSLKIICFGNSITRGYKVGTAASVEKPYPQVLQKLLRDKFKNPSIQVINEGHNGWRSDQALANIRTLVINQKPDLLILKLGINDVYSGFSPAIYRQNIAKMIEMLQTIHTKIILMNPTPILTPLNAKVLTYSPVLRNLAQEKGIAFLNLYQKIIDKKENSELLWAEVLPDDVHFADNQYRWIAEILVEYLNVE
ncbi:MAG: SGNH/GDSL hydrolase family protein [Microscillaceae bacterium]|nr:SGNH/GDSL hydrolase family protein [Microscillaceae bacterium]